MDPGLETAVLEALERAETGADVSPEWLRRAHPQWWRDVQAFLRVHDGLHAGRPDVGRIGPYRVRQRLGEGGMGTVYLAEAERTHGEVGAGTLVALKVVHAHLLARPRFLERALREARVGSAVVHENVVRTLDFGLAPGPPRDVLYLVTEHVDGQNLRGLLGELGAVPEDLCRHIAREVLRALVAVHAAGAVHRDLKPENVLLSRDGKVKVTDFGAAHALDPAGTITRSGEFLGSLPYAAPEQILRPADRVDGRADLYALGVMLHELTSGAHPFLGATPRGEADADVHEGPAARTRATQDDVAADAPLTDAPRLGGGVSAFFAAFVATLLAHEPAARFPSAAAALEALDAGEGSAWWRRTRAAASAGTRPQAVPSRVIVGRAAELARIRAAYDDVAAGHGRTLVVAGEAGVGKSLLAEEALARLGRCGAPPSRIVGRFEPGAAPDAPCVWTVALREHFAGDDAEDAIARHLAEVPDLAAPFAALLRDDAAARAAPPAHESQCAAAAAILRSLARERPVALLVEDLHLADDVARRQLAQLARGLATDRVLVLVTTRPADGESQDDFDDAADADRVVLDRLPPHDVHALLSGLLGAGLAADRALAVVQRRSDGNPYFVVELVRHLRETGTIVPAADGGWDLVGDADEVPLPRTLRATVERRLADLDPSDRRLLSLAACIGFVFDPELLAEATGRSLLDVLRTLARSERRRRLVRSSGGRCTFDHHVVQETLVASLGEAAMRAHHAALAGVLEQRAASAAAPRPDAALAVFDHWVRAGDGPRASRWLDGTLRRLEATCRASDAVRLIRLALDVPGAVPAPRRAEVLVELAPYLDILGRRDEEHDVLRVALALALESGPPRIAARARAELSRCLFRLGRHAEAESEALAAIEASRGTQDTVTQEIAQSVAGLAAIAMDRVAEGIRRHEEQLRIARASGDPQRESDAEDCVGAARGSAGEFAAAVVHLQRALDLVRSLPAQPAYSGMLRSRLAHCLMLTGRWEEAGPLIDEQMRLSRRIGDVTSEAWSRLLASRIVERRGDRDEAIRLARNAADTARRLADPQFEHIALRFVAGLLLRAGRTEEALGVSAASRAIAERLRLAPGVVLCHAADAEALSLVGAHEEAVAAAGRADDAARSSPLRLAQRTALLARARCAAHGRGDAGLLREVLRLAREQGDACGVTQGLLDLGLAATGGGDAGGCEILLEALAAGRALRDGDVVAPAVARLASLGAIPADAARDECALHAAALPVRSRLGVEHDLWRATGDPSHLDEARRQLDVVWAAAPERHRDAVVSRIALHQTVALGG